MYIYIYIHRRRLRGMNSIEQNDEYQVVVGQLSAESAIILRCLSPDRPIVSTKRTTFVS